MVKTNLHENSMAGSETEMPVIFLNQVKRRKKKPESINFLYLDISEIVKEMKKISGVGNPG